MNAFRTFLSSPAFGILLTITAFSFGLWVKRKLRSDFAHPMLIAVVTIILFLTILRIPYEQYKVGGDYIHFFLAPLTVALGLTLYRERRVLLKRFLPLMIGITSGVLTSFVSITRLARLFGRPNWDILTMLPKSITTPMALSLNKTIGGEPAILIVLIIVTGITGAILAPLLPKCFPFLSRFSIGAGIGTASHAVGTSKALEMGEEEGAVSSASIGLAGLITVILVPLLVRWLL
ncbi:MAG: LrgB family protein [Bacillota bacterium]|nr:LrgB family protein [Bacillota bacterium]